MSDIPHDSSPAKGETPKATSGRRGRPAGDVPYARAPPSGRSVGRPRKVSAVSDSDDEIVSVHAHSSESSLEDCEGPKPSTSKARRRRVRVARGEWKNIDEHSTPPTRYSHDEIFAMLKRREVNAIGKRNFHGKNWCPFCLSVQSNVTTHVTTHFNLPKLPESETKVLKREIQALVTRWKREVFPAHMAGFRARCNLLQYCKFESVEAAQSFVDIFYEEYNYIVPFSIESLQDRPSKYIVREEDLRPYASLIGPEKDVMSERQSKTRSGKYSRFADIGDLKLDEQQQVVGWSQGNAKGSGTVDVETMRESGSQRMLNEEDHQLCVEMREWLERQTALKTHNTTPTNYIASEATKAINAFMRVMIVAMRLQSNYVVIRTAKDLPLNIDKAYDRLASLAEEINKATGSNYLTHNFFNAVEALKHMDSYPLFPRGVMERLEYLRNGHVKISNFMAQNAAKNLRQTILPYTTYMSVMRRLEADFGAEFGEELRRIRTERKAGELVENDQFRKNWNKYSTFLAGLLIMENGQRAEVLYKLRVDQVTEAKLYDETTDTFIIDFPQNKTKAAQQVIVCSAELMESLRDYLAIRRVIWNNKRTHCDESKRMRFEKLMFLTADASAFTTTAWAKNWQAMIAEREEVLGELKLDEVRGWTLHHVRKAACNTQIRALLDIFEIPNKGLPVTPLQGHKKKTALKRYFTESKHMAVGAYAYLRHMEDEEGPLEAKGCTGNLELDEDDDDDIEEMLDGFHSEEIDLPTTSANITPNKQLTPAKTPRVTPFQTPRKSPMKRTVTDDIGTPTKKLKSSQQMFRQFRQNDVASTIQEAAEEVEVHSVECSQKQATRNEARLEAKTRGNLARNQVVMECARKITVKGGLADQSVRSRMVVWDIVVEELPNMTEEQRTKYLAEAELPSVAQLRRVTSDATEFVHYCAAEFYPHIAIKYPSQRPAHMGHLGYGVTATMALKKGTFICEYKGKVFTEDEAVSERAYATACGTSSDAYAAKIQHKRSRTIQGCIAKFLACNNITVADTRLITFGALVNKSVKHPNCKLVLINDMVYGRGEIWCLQALRPITEGEELLWDHGTKHFNPLDKQTNICPCCYCIGHCWCSVCKGGKLHGQRKLDTVDAILDMYVTQVDGGGKTIYISKCDGIHVALSTSIPNDRVRPPHLDKAPRAMNGMKKISALLCGQKRDANDKPLDDEAFQKKLHKYTKTFKFSAQNWAEILFDNPMVRKGRIFDENIHQAILAVLKSSDHPMVIVTAEGKEDLFELVHKQTNFYRGREPTGEEGGLPPKGWLFVKLTSGENAGYHAVYGLHGANSQEDGVYPVPFII